MNTHQLSLTLSPSKHRPKSGSTAATDTDKVIQIQNAIDKGTPYKVISRKYKVSMATISRIKHKKNHRHIL